ncbi:DUF4214 domain-containing protein [Massilia solisilvae]|uniref:DUF4214 domain-containing protein n=1 Tax=Massilia solisilvae TaxID=1811225 RepID=A0ABT2BNG8_9BURK|nr:DUF4214 domain-containing protein [Massilia solisilvae]MCS0609438.1 DUF4214 domain-containing protein [Massilia solisilvae]
MANLTLSNPFLSFDALPDWNWAPAAATSTSITYTNGAQKIVLTGEFVVTADTMPSGRVTEVSFLQASTEVFKVTGLELSAAMLTNLIDNVTDSRQTFAYLLSGNDTIKGTSYNDQLYGYAGDDTIQAGMGNDLIIGGPGNDTIDGGIEIDTVRYTGAIADYKIERTTGGVAVTGLKGDSGTDTLVNVERVEFGDKIFLPVDVTGASGQLFRLYQAALDRKPDADGMNYWEAQMERGLYKLENIAQEFIKSAEYQKLYGSGLTNAELVGKYYEHILHRTGEKAGIDFWAGVLDSHAATNAQVLAAISDSPENVQQSVALIGTGLVVDHPVITI